MRRSSWGILQKRLEEGGVLRQAAGFANVVMVGRDCPAHAHTAIEMVFHPTGAGVSTLADGTGVRFGAGDVVLYAPGVRHDQRMSAAGLDCCVQVEAPPGLQLRGHLLVRQLDDEALRAELEYLAARSPGGSPTTDALLNLRSTAALLQLVALAFMRADIETVRIERRVLAAERFVRDNHATIGSVGEIARAAGVGADHLRHGFRQRRGKSVVGYLAEVRLAHARALLAHTVLPIKEVALRCGYQDVYYFSTIFKKRCGCAPGRYRTKTNRALP